MNGKKDLYQLPEDLLNQFASLVEHQDQSQWNVGKFISEVVDEFAEAWEASGIRNGRAAVIKCLCNSRGNLDESTARDRQNVYEFWKDKLEPEYEVFSWSQLRAIKSAGNRWEKYAVWALDHLPSPAWRIRKEIKGNGDGLPIWSDYWERIISLAERLSREENLPDKIRSIIKAILESE